MPRAAHLGRRSWVGRHRQAERLSHLLRGRVLHRHRETLRRERHLRPRRPRRLAVLRRGQLGNRGSQDNNIDNSTPFGRTEDSAWRYLSSDMRWKIVPRETRTTLSCERRRVPFWIRVDFAPLSARTSGVSGATSSQAGCNKTSQC